MNNTIRLAKHAGSWYTANPHELDKELSHNLSQSKNELGKQIPVVKGIIGPHAGFAYSGPVAAWAYQYLQLEEPPEMRVFLLGPSHKKAFSGCALSCLEEYQTPLGNIKVDTETLAEVGKQIKSVKLTKAQEESEHSLQMHLPYLKKVFKDKMKLVPIMVGGVDSKSADHYGKVLSKYLDQKDTIFVISSDFCHWGQHFDYQPYDKKKGKIWQYIEQMDRQGMSLIEKQQIKGFYDYLETTGNTICGENPIKVFMSAIEHSGLSLETKFVQYGQSDKVKDQNGSSVSYASSVTYIK